MVGLRASAQAASRRAAAEDMDMLKAEIATARQRIARAAGVDAASIRILIEL
jgi:hypothetical protein